MACSVETCGGIKWSSQQVGIMSECELFDLSGHQFDCSHKVMGVQSVGYDANFGVIPIFQLCQSEIYELKEELPTVNITLSKALDGWCPAYVLATKDANNPTLFGRAPTKASIAIATFPCDGDSAQGAPKSIVVFSGVQVGSVGYTFDTSNAFTEDVSFVGNNMIWYSDVTHPAYAAGGGNCTLSQAFIDEVATISFSGCCDTNDGAPRTKVQTREDFLFAYDNTVGLDINGMVADPDTTILPPEVFGISGSGTNENESVTVQSITVQADLNREEIFSLGRRGPKNRTITPPIPVNVSITVIADYDALVSATEEGVCAAPTGDEGCGYADDRCSGIGTNLQNRTIRIATCDGTRIYTGVRNKLASINRSGGSTGGENLTVTYNFQTFNTMTVLHCNEQDCVPSGTEWWTNRDAWLTNV